MLFPKKGTFVGTKRRDERRKYSCNVVDGSFCAEVVKAVRGKEKEEETHSEFQKKIFFRQLIKLFSKHARL